MRVAYLVWVVDPAAFYGLALGCCAGVGGVVANNGYLEEGEV